MLSMHQILSSLVICLLMQNVISQEVPELMEEYIDEELPETQVDPETAVKPFNETNNHKAKFAEDRFTQLFGQPRTRNQPKPTAFFPKFASKAKPTLPPFIKRTPALIKVTPSTVSPVQNQRLNQRTSTTTQRPTTARASARGQNANNRRNQNQVNNNSGRTTTTTTASPVGATDSSRRRFGGSNRRLSANGTIPATTSRPRRF